MRVIFFALAFFALNLQAAQTGQMALPSQLQKETPWFAFLAEYGENSYNGTFNFDNLKNEVKPSTKRLVLSLFATYCVPCREEFQTLRERKAELDENGVQVYLVDVGERDFDKAKKFAEQYAGDAFPLYFDPFGNSLHDFGISKSGDNVEGALPLMLILDKNLKALKILFGKAGEDFPEVLWK